MVVLLRIEGGIQVKVHGYHGGLIADHAVDRREAVLTDAPHRLPWSIELERARETRDGGQHAREPKRDCGGPCQQQPMAASINIVALPVGDRTIRV